MFILNNQLNLFLRTWPKSCTPIEQTVITASVIWIRSWSSNNSSWERGVNIWICFASKVNSVMTAATSRCTVMTATLRITISSCIVIIGAAYILTYTISCTWPWTCSKLTGDVGTLLKQKKKEKNSTVWFLNKGNIW